MIENVSWSQKRLGFLPSSLWKVFLKFFLPVTPIPIRTNSDKASVHRAFSRLKRKTRMYFRRFFRLSAYFRPHSSAIFHPNTHIMFYCPLSAYDKWWFEQKKSPHFREKYLVLSYLKGSVERSRHERHFCSLLPYFLLSWLQIFQLCLSFCTSSPDLVLFKKFLQEKEKYPKNHPKRLSS